MRWLLAGALCLGAGTTAAQEVSVRSGEHPGFSRLAFDLPRREAWRFGRTDSGYGLALEGGAQLDLSRVWQAMGRERIAALVQDADGTLRLTLGCTTCHATAFESRPGTLVIDVHDGAAPAQARFEARLDALDPPPRPHRRVDPITPDLPAPVPVGYDWTALPREPQELPMPPALDPFRDAVLRQLAEGAARGLVDMVDRLPPRPAISPLPPQIRMEEAPGFIRDAAEPLTAEGRACVPDDRLAIASWGTEEPVSVALAPARAGLVGEFDTPDPAAVERAIRYHLFLGFGAEARQLAAVFAVPAEDRQLYDAMARILDGEPDGDDTLATMASCTGNAALWGLLSLPHPRAGEPEQTGAALQAFVALPKHLRRDLAPLMVARFEARQDKVSAQVVRDAVVRTQPDPDPATRLLVSRNAQDGEAQLKTLVAEGGHSADDALIALADRQLTAGSAVAPHTLTALHALLRERTGGADEAALRRLVILGLASTTEFDAAFADLPSAPAAEPELWAWLARMGGDDPVLRHAVLDGPAPAIPAATRIALAERLTALGLPDPALRWLPEDAGTEAERLAAARAHLARRDARSALRQIAGLEGEAAAKVRQAAEAQLSPAPANPDMPAPPPVADMPDGPLAQGKALLSDAASTRDRIEALLNAAAMPR